MSARVHLRSGDRALVRELLDHLDAYVDGGPPALDLLVPGIAGALRATAALGYGLRVVDGRLELAFARGAGTVDSPSGIRDFGAFLRTVDTRWGFFNPSRPEPAQRNVVLSWLELTPENRPASAGQLLYPRFGLAGIDQLRVLVCDGPSLLAWIGGWRPESFTDRDRVVLRLLVPAMRRRLVLERLLETDREARASLAAALEAIPRPAFVVTGTGSVRHCNAAGATQLDRRPRDLVAALRASLAHAPRSPYEVFPVRAGGLPQQYLVVHRRLPPGVPLPVADAVARWHLSPRQSSVLRLLARGCANRTIAAALDLAENTVEHHVTRLLHRAGVDSRAALVARLWNGG